MGNRTWQESAVFLTGGRGRDRTPICRLQKLFGRARRETQSLAERLERFELFHTPPLKPRPRADREREDDSRITSNTQEFE